MAKEQAQITLRIPAVRREWLEHIAEKEYRSLNQQIEKFLDEAVERWKAANGRADDHRVSDGGF